MSDVVEDVIIVGGGAAGLACARALQARGKDFLLLEASPNLGGRLATDSVEGFALDRGFQIFLTAYPEARRHLKYADLKLGYFQSGAMVRQDGGFATLPSPLLEPGRLAETLRSPVGSFFDKVRVALFVLKELLWPTDPLDSPPRGDAYDELVREGFSRNMIEGFFRPFFGGVFLEDRLHTDGRLLAFLFRQFALGRAALPAGGMFRVAENLARGLPSARLRREQAVEAVEAGRVILAGGERRRARHVVVAVDGGAASSLLGTPARQFHAAYCLYFRAPRSPLKEAYLVLNPARDSAVHHLCVPSDAASGYAPPGQSLISVSCVGAQPDVHTVLTELVGWFGPQVEEWSHLRTYSIAQALPAFPSGSVRGTAKLAEGLWQCGDQAGYPSLNSALETGRQVGEAISASL